MNSFDAARPQQLNRLLRWSLLAGVAGLALCALALLFDRTQVFRAYLVAYVFWSGISLGCAALLMLHTLTGGRWGEVITRLLKAGMITLPLVTLLFIPIVFGLNDLYSWADRAAVAENPLLAHKQLYLNVPFFLLRAAGYFAIWLMLALVTLRSRKYRTAFSAGWLILLLLTMTFAAFDWVMSIEPEWYSSLFGLLVAVGQVVSALAFVIAILYLFRNQSSVVALLNPHLLGDLGNLLLALVSGWVYLAFMQFLVIWSGNLPEEIIWYLERTRHGWQWITLAIILLGFIVPFGLLLMSNFKRNARRLTLVASIVLVACLINTFWLVMPGYETTARLPILSIFAVIGIGGFWLALFLFYLRNRPLVVDETVTANIPEHAT